MTKYGENYVIIKADLKDGFVKKHEYKGLVEYWTYQAKKSHIFKLDGSKATIRNIDDAQLYCIIVCEQNHITVEKEESLLIKGYRFTDENLHDYLRKTGRSRSY